jgi:hypothetical protein
MPGAGAVVSVEDSSRMPNREQLWELREERAGVLQEELVVTVRGQLKEDPVARLRGQLKVEQVVEAVRPTMSYLHR